MKKHPLVLIAICAVVVVAVCWWILSSAVPEGNSQGTETPRSGNDPVSRQPARDFSNPAVGGSPGAPSDSTVDQAAVTRLIEAALAAMKSGDPEQVRRSLADLAAALGAKGNRDAAIAAIVAFLGTGEDADTGMGFIVGEGGALRESTTLRVYLMDWLGRLSREAGGREALEIGRQTLASFGSPDEWAISMRNVAWSDPSATAFLDDKVNAMLRHPRWQAHPSTGMLEAFDVIVHTGSMKAVPELARQISLQDPVLGRASGVALDRLATFHALELTTLLNGNRDLLATTPLLRADLFAHADLSVPEQRAQLETYLLRPDVAPDEREKFFSSLIQTGQFVSHNLITPFVPPEEPAQAAERLGTLVETVNGWMRDPRFSPLSGELAAFGEAVNGIVDEISADEAIGGEK